MKTFDKYKQNLKVDGNNIISYTTKVAEIIGNKLVCLNWTVKAGFSKSQTTNKHLNYVASELGLTIISEDNYAYIQNNLEANLYNGTNEGIVLN